MAQNARELTDAQLRMILAPGIGPATYRKLIDAFGCPDVVMGATVKDLAALDGLGSTVATSLRRAMDSVEPELERDAMAKGGARLIPIDDDDYPPLLAAIDSAPPALWVRGEVSQRDNLSIAIVGSRRCTTYGREQAGRFGALLAQAGLTVISGGAVGIDGEAHRGALRVKGRTIAVLGCGLSHCYPEQHEQLFERIVEHGGAMVSEYPMQTPPRATNFPRRNRIISGLSLGVLVIEAARRSGALITARLAAADHGREVMALPGRVDSPASAGCLAALRDGLAALVCDHTDVLNQLEAARHLLRGAVEARGGDVPAETGPSLFDNTLTEPQQAIMRTLADSGEPMLVDQIAASTQLPMSRLMAELTLLQIRGCVARDHRGVRLGTSHQKQAIPRAEAQ